MRIDNKKLDECCNFSKLNEIGEKTMLINFINIILIPFSAKFLLKVLSYYFFRFQKLN